MNTVTANASAAGPLTAGQRVAMHYFVAAMVLFFAQILFGMISGLQYIMPDLFYNVLDFNVTRMVHINAMVVWLLFGFMGSVYWLVEDAAGTELVGARLARRSSIQPVGAAGATLTGNGSAGGREKLHAADQSVSARKLAAAAGSPA